MELLLTTLLQLFVLAILFGFGICTAMAVMGSFDPWKERYAKKKAEQRIFRRKELS